jgi:hypothetical protein
VEKNNNWVTVIRFGAPHEAELARAKLESEGLSVHILDSYTIQADPLYSNAIGGVKVQVMTTEFDQANKVLIESGFMNEPPVDENSFYAVFDRNTSKLPLLNTLSVQLRLIAVAALVLVGAFVPIGIAIAPSDFDKLTENQWCIDQMYFEKVSVYLLGDDDDYCSLTIYFDDDGLVDLPSMSGDKFTAAWEEKNGMLEISRWAQGGGELPVDSIYFGEYVITMKNSVMMLASDKMIITGDRYGAY